MDGLIGVWKSVPAVLATEDDTTRWNKFWKSPVDGITEVDASEKIQTKLTIFKVDSGLSWKEDGEVATQKLITGLDPDSETEIQSVKIESRPPFIHDMVAKAVQANAEADADSKKNTEIADKLAVTEKLATTAGVGGKARVSGKPLKGIKEDGEHVEESSDSEHENAAEWDLLLSTPKPEEPTDPTDALIVHFIKSHGNTLMRFKNPELYDQCKKLVGETVPITPLVNEKLLKAEEGEMPKETGNVELDAKVVVAKKAKERKEAEKKAPKVHVYHDVEGEALVIIQPLTKDGLRYYHVRKLQLSKENELTASQVIYDCRGRGGLGKRTLKFKKVA